jgi:hypothetical protein
MQPSKVQISPLTTSLDSPDFFAITGMAMKVDDIRVKICGH